MRPSASSIAAVVLVAIAALYLITQIKDAPPTPSALPADGGTAFLAQIKQRYTSDPVSVRKEFVALLAQRNWDGASKLVGGLDPTDKAEAARWRTEAAIERYKDDLTRVHITEPAKRHAIYLRLAALEPNNPAWGRLAKIAEVDTQRRMAQQAADEARFRRKQGVSVGMTKERVLQSSWGRPARVNRTTTVHGTREQWAYDRGNYLYFNEAGFLTSIQTRN